jgi:hypothetical protein
MKLKDKLRSLLKDLPRTYFFTPTNSKHDLIGGLKGQLTYFMILENGRKISHNDILFGEKIRRCGGQHFTIRSIQDFCELAKVRGWYD